MTDKARPIERIRAEQAAIAALFDAYRKLRDELGWREVIYAPRNGTQIEVLELGSTGIHKATGDADGFLIDGDWPTRFILFRFPAGEVSR